MPFDQRVRVVAQDFAVVAGARLALVRIADQVFLARRVAGHEAPLKTSRETGAATTTQAGCLDDVDNLVGRQLAEDFLPGNIATYVR